MNDRYLTAMKEKHHNIDISLIAEENKPFPNEALIQSLKKKKLTLKDQIEELLQEA